MTQVKIDSLVRSKKRKYIALIITPKGELVVRAPWRAADSTIDALVKKHFSWIQKKKKEVKSRSKVDPLPESRVEAYKKEAMRVIEQRSTIFCQLTGYRPKSITISNAKTRWGSCSPKGRIRISWRLVMAPPEILDYVIVHELVHLSEKNHAKRFWNKVKSIFPNYRECRRWLRTNGHALQ